MTIDTQTRAEVLDVDPVEDERLLHWRTPHMTGGRVDVEVKLELHRFGADVIITTDDGSGGESIDFDPAGARAISRALTEAADMAEEFISRVAAGTAEAVRR